MTDISHYLGKYHTGISNNDYHAMKEFYSSSQLKNAKESPATFRWYLENKNASKTEWSPSYTDAKDFGSLVHCLLLEPHKVKDEFIFMDTIGVNFRTTEGKALKGKFMGMAEKSGKILMAATDLEKARFCKEAALAHPFARKLLEAQGQAEISGFYKDETSGLHLRFRPDRLLMGMGIIMDIKTTQDIEKFEQVAKWTFSYDLSAYMYLEGNKHLTGEMFDFYFLVIESQAPFRVAVYKASKDFLAVGRSKFTRALESVKIAMSQTFTPTIYQKADYEEI